MSEVIQQRLDYESSARDSIRQKVVAECVKRLNAIGAEYAIRLDGVKFGNVEIAEKAPSRRGPKVHDWRSHTESIKRLGVGDTATIRPDNPDDLRALASACSAHANKHFGSGNFMTSMDRKQGSVTVIRLG